jgi:hypothetical protein
MVDIHALVCLLVARHSRSSAARSNLHVQLAQLASAEGKATTNNRLLKGEKQAVVACARELSGWEQQDIDLEVFKDATGKEPDAATVSGLFDAYVAALVPPGVASIPWALLRLSVAAVAAGPTAAPPAAALPAAVVPTRAPPVAAVAAGPTAAPPTAALPAAVVPTRAPPVAAADAGPAAAPPAAALPAAVVPTRAPPVAAADAGPAAAPPAAALPAAVVPPRTLPVAAAAAANHHPAVAHAPADPAPAHTTITAMPIGDPPPAPDPPPTSPQPAIATMPPGRAQRAKHPSKRMRGD